MSAWQCRTQLEERADRVLQGVQVDASNIWNPSRWGLVGNMGTYYVGIISVLYSLIPV